MKPGTKAAIAGVVAVVMASGVKHHHHGGVFGVLDSTAVPAGGPSSQQAWARSVLRAGGWPRTGADITSLEAWANHEDPWNNAPPDGGEYTKNPLNLTYGPGAIGSVPGTPNVSILPNWQVGVQDTAGRIGSGPFSDVAAALASGNGLCGRSFTGLHNWSAGPAAAASAGYWSVC